MDPEVERALQTDRLIDITTTGRKSGQPHRIEIAFHYIDGEVYISGMPGKRDWYANLRADPSFTFHLKQSIHRDLPARATPILDEEDRRTLLDPITTKWGRQNQIEVFVARSPLVRVEFI
jgi:deazaflavin-dependent oxidoreductase (nitroreductase family)